jgi:hypothetical protein
MKFSKGCNEQRTRQPNPHRLMSLDSRIKAIHRALTAEELADLLQMSRITILRRAKRGRIPSFRVGS